MKLIKYGVYILIVATFLLPSTYSYYGGNQCDLIKEYIQKQIDNINLRISIQEQTVINECGEEEHCIYNGEKKYFKEEKAIYKKELEYFRNKCTTEVVYSDINQLKYSDEKFDLLKKQNRDLSEKLDKLKKVSFIKKIKSKFDLLAKKELDAITINEITYFIEEFKDYNEEYYKKALTLLDRKKHLEIKKKADAYIKEANHWLELRELKKAQSYFQLSCYQVETAACYYGMGKAYFEMMKNFYKQKMYKSSTTYFDREQKNAIESLEKALKFNDIDKYTINQLLNEIKGYVENEENKKIQKKEQEKIEIEKEYKTKINNQVDTIMQRLEKMTTNMPSKKRNQLYSKLLLELDSYKIKVSSQNTIDILNEFQSRLKNLKKKSRDK